MPRYRLSWLSMCLWWNSSRHWGNQWRQHFKRKQFTDINQRQNATSLPPPPPTSFFGYGKVIIKKKNCSLNFERTFARISFRVNHLFLEVSRQKNSPIPFFWRYALSVYVYLLLIEKYLQMLEVTTNLICFLSVWSCEREKKYKIKKTGKRTF